MTNNIFLFLNTEHQVRIFKSISDKYYIFSCLGFYDRACIQVQFLNLNNLKKEFEVFSVHNITFCIFLNQIKQSEIYIFSTSFSFFCNQDV